MKEEKEIRFNDFESVNNLCTIGKIKDNKIEMFRKSKKFKRIGAVDVELLQEFLWNILDNQNKSIGIYITQRKKEVSFLHCQGWCVAGLRITEKNEREEQNKKEFARIEKENCDEVHLRRDFFQDMEMRQ